MLVAVSVLIGLTLAAGLGGPPAAPQSARRVPRADRARRPARDRPPRRRAARRRVPEARLAGIAIPFVIDYRPVYVAPGIIGGYLAARSASPSTRAAGSAASAGASCTAPPRVVYVLGLIHTLGAGTDAGSSWLRAFMLATAVPAAGLLVARLRKTGAPPVARHQGSTTA